MNVPDAKTRGVLSDDPLVKQPKVIEKLYVTRLRILVEELCPAIDAVGLSAKVAGARVGVAADTILGVVQLDVEIVAVTANTLRLSLARSAQPPKGERP